MVPTTRSIRAAPASTRSSTPSRASTLIPVGWMSSPAPTGPGCGARSSTSTAAPARASNVAAASPAVPGPDDTRPLKLVTRLGKAHIPFMRIVRGPTEVRMTSIRNLPLAARLGGAFGVLCLALAIVAFAGMTALSGLREDADNLGERQLVAADLLGGMQERAKDNVGLIGLHLYVNDGDLAAQDEHFKEIEGNWAKSKPDGAKLEQLFKGSAVEEEFAAWAATRAKMLELQKQALEASRNETVANAEDRSGSRTLYERQLLPLDSEMEAAGREARRRHHRRRRDRRQGGARLVRQRRRA